MASHLHINGRRVGPGEPAYIIAELSANHNQDFETALAHVQAARDMGADAIKLQTYTPDTMTIACDSDYFRIKGTVWEGRTLYDLYGDAYTPWEWHPRLKAAALDLGLDFFSTPFDESAVDFLEDLDVPVFKVASFENVDLPLIRRVAKTGKPVIMSTGMASFEEVEEAVQTARDAGVTELALLKCTSAYPAPPEDANLRTIPHLARHFQLPVGLSDHTMNTAVPVTAVALGACIIEKHFILDRSTGGVDSSFSLEPREFKEMVDAVRTTEKALGEVVYRASQKEQENRVFRRSLFVVQDVRAGEPFTPENVRSIRPGHGLHTRHLDEVLGRRAAVDIKRGTPLSWALTA
jgi:pseudaminic acid synthase